MFTERLSNSLIFLTDLGSEHAGQLLLGLAVLITCLCVVGWAALFRLHRRLRGMFEQLQKTQVTLDHLKQKEYRRFLLEAKQPTGRAAREPGEELAFGASPQLSHHTTSGIERWAS